MMNFKGMGKVIESSSSELLDVKMTKAQTQEQ